MDEERAGTRSETKNQEARNSLVKLLQKSQGFTLQGPGIRHGGSRCWDRLESPSVSKGVRSPGGLQAASEGKWLGLGFRRIPHCRESKCGWRILHKLNMKSVQLRKREAE